MSNAEKIAKVLAIIEQVKYAMFSTVNAKGDVHAWPMTTTKADLDNKAIWFIGDKGSDIVADIKTNKKVGLSYATQDEKNYLSISADAELVDDKDKLDELWSPIYDSFFEHGKEDEAVQLIKVIPHGAEYWTSGSSLINAFKMVSAMIQDGKTAEDIGENDIVEF
ncbi:pyridoxamine 5'-phosphate oxidase family protein [Psychrobacter sp.]|uniref:pyridoxamine 5'-phosphate oxidase family protein n=1 Tax=Psychrobacter sp. TaxID=56811 RepID=UPI0025EE338C|nr:pyridoxamine 5'-phosphate oxidase family protein [Psychrobacter sp.]